MAQRWKETFLHDTDSGVPLETFTVRLCRGGLPGIFADYTAVTTRDHALLALACANNPTLNRFRDIQCLDATRVTLTTSPHDYINANYVDGFRDPHKFICTQGPLEHTMGDFWRMVWQEGTVVIAALTRFGGGKCETYLPTTRAEKHTYGPITVVNLGTRNIRDTYDATALMLLNGATMRRALHICYHAWPDKGTPTDPTEMLRLVDDINFNHHRLVNDGRAKGWLPPVGIHVRP
jgi:tyrosine-protein phosphatase non-receptor type 9